MNILKLILTRTTVLAGMIFQTVGCSSAGKTSDHFDGKRFFNPEGREVGGFWATARVMYTLATSDGWVDPPKDAKEHALPEQPKDNRIEVTFVNHASFIIQSSDFVILTDPVWSKRASPFNFAGPTRYREPGIKFDSLRRVDIVLVSHNHYDHMEIATLSKLKKKFDPYFVVAVGDKRHLEDAGITKVQELDWWEEAKLPAGISVTFTPAQHFSSRGLFDRNKSLWGSFMLKTHGKQVYFGGDTGYASHFKQVEAKFGAPDLALLPIGAYEPYWFMGPIHMNPSDAVKAHTDIKSKRSIGMHFGTFKLTTEPIDQPAKDLAASLSEKGIAAEQFTVPVEGSTFTLK